MKYEKVYDAMVKINAIKKELGLEEVCLMTGKLPLPQNRFISEQDFLIATSIELLQTQLHIRARELQEEGLISTKVNSVNAVTNLLSEIDNSFGENK